MFYQGWDEFVANEDSCGRPEADMWYHHLFGLFLLTLP
jgi:hypothetical protein